MFCEERSSSHIPYNKLIFKHAIQPVDLGLLSMKINNKPLS